MYRMKCEDCGHEGAPDITDDVVTCKACASHNLKMVRDETERTMQDWLIFEAQEPPPPPMLHRGEQAVQWGPTPEAPPLQGYSCIGGVRATDENAACRAVVGATRRVGKYAVIAATFIDFTQGLTEPEANRPVLNP